MLLSVGFLSCKVETFLTAWSSVILHETVHKLQQENLNEMILKLSLKNPMMKPNGIFLTLQMKEFRKSGLIL